MAELRLFWDYMSEQVERIRRVVEVLERCQVRYAVVGGHAVSYHWKPRVTVDVDFLVGARSLPRLENALPAAGFHVERRGEILGAWERGADPAVDDPVVDLVPAELNETQAEALRGAVPVRYQGLTLRIVTRPAVVALKFLAARSPHRDHGDKFQDLADISHLAKQAWTSEDDAEARRLVELTRPGAGRELGQLVDDLRHDRPITI